MCGMRQIADVGGNRQLRQDLPFADELWPRRVHSDFVIFTRTLALAARYQLHGLFGLRLHLRTARWPPEEAFEAALTNPRLEDRRHTVNACCEGPSGAFLRPVL
jgi:hypothetical protein